MRRALAFAFGLLVGSVACAMIASPGHMMGPIGSGPGGSASGKGILTESSNLITTEGGVALRTET